MQFSDLRIFILFLGCFSLALTKATFMGQEDVPEPSILSEPLLKALKDEQKEKCVHDYIHLKDENEGLYYAFYPARNVKEENVAGAPLILWLGGGPGTSSLLALFQGIGPKEMFFDLEVKDREVSWNDENSILFVDSPVGVGYSYAAAEDSIPVTSKQVAEQLLKFLDKFFGQEQFKKFRSAPFYIFGEGFAAHYMVDLAQAILNERKKSGEEQKIADINLRGIGFGNGWVDPIHQIKDFGLIAYTLGLVNERGRAAIEKYQLQAALRLQSSNLYGALVSMDKIRDQLKLESGLSDLGNYYSNVEHFTVGLVEKYLNQKKVMEDYKVKIDKVPTFIAHNNEMLRKLRAEIMTSVAEDFVKVVEHLPVLIWNGQYDLITPTSSAVNWLTQLEWSGAGEWRNANREEITGEEKEIIGMKKCAGNLCLIMLDHCGHHCAEEKPEATKQMVNKFINNSK